MPAASTLKAILLVAYLRQSQVRSRRLGERDRALLAPMVRRSDNVTATRVRDQLGPRLARFAARAGMRRFHPHRVWGLTRVDAADLSRFMLHAEHLTPPRHRFYAMRLLQSIVPSQRWGIAKAAPPGWTLRFKSGWGSGTGRVDHQVALLERGEQHLAVAITTTDNGSHRTGKATLRGVARRLLAGLERVEG